MTDIFVTRYNHNGIIVINDYENKERYQGYSFRAALKHYRNEHGYSHKHLNIILTEEF